MLLGDIIDEFVAGGAKAGLGFDSEADIRSAADDCAVVGLANRGGAKETDRFGMDKETDVLVAFLDRLGNKSRIVKYAKRLRSSELDEKEIESLLREISAVRK